MLRSVTSASCCALALGLCLTVGLSGCATRASSVLPAPANKEDFAGWSCERMHDEIDRVQQKAAELAWAVDGRVGNNILALGLGVTVFWPALLAMRPQGLEASDLARLKGRYEALNLAQQRQGCAPSTPDLPARRAQALPVALGEKLVYEDRSGPRGAATLSSLQLLALRRGEIEFRSSETERSTWVQDLAGNVVSAPQGALSWPRLLRSELELGQVIAGDFQLVGDPLLRARMHGQVVAVGPQTVAERRFDVAVVELFGDAQSGDAYTRVDGAIVIDRSSGVLLRLDLRSANPAFSLQRRLLRVEPAAR